MHTPTRLEGHIKKGWGYELIWATNEKYCGKIMIFDKVGAKFSMHFHKEKDETWFVNSGRFLLRWINTETADLIEQELKDGDTWHNPPLQPHNYRIGQGDSQKDVKPVPLPT